jgi:hypothetical protein
MVLTLMRRLCPFVQEGRPHLFLLDSSLALNQRVHGAFEGVKVLQSLNIGAARILGVFVEESMLSEPLDSGSFNRLVPVREGKEIVRLNVSLCSVSSRGIVIYSIGASRVRLARVITAQGAKLDSRIPTSHKSSAVTPGSSEERE